MSASASGLQSLLDMSFHLRNDLMINQKKTKRMRFETASCRRCLIYLSHLPVPDLFSGDSKVEFID